MLTVIEKTNAKSTLKISGDVRVVLEGCVTKKNIKGVESDAFRFALGSGTFNTPESLGEALILGGASYVSWVEEGGVRTEMHHHVTSPFILGLDKQQVAAALLYHAPEDEPITLKMLYEELAQQHVQGFAIVGQANIIELYSTYMHKPPIFGVNINQHAAEYWHQIPKETDKQICFFGVVIPNKAKKHYSPQLINRAFYQNPHESKVISMASHTHGAVLTSEQLKQPANTQAFFGQLQDFMPKASVSIRHLLMQSLIHEGIFAIFPLDNMVDG